MPNMAGDFFYSVCFSGSLLCGGVCDLYWGLSPTTKMCPYDVD